MRRRREMKKTTKFHLPDIYFGFVLLAIIGIIDLIAGLILPWITTLMEYFKK